MRGVDGPYPPALAGARVHVDSVHDFCHMHSRVEQPDGPQVLWILCVLLFSFRTQADGWTGWQISPARRIQDKQRPLRESLPCMSRHRQGLPAAERWANQICADDDQERAIVLASMK